MTIQIPSDHMEQLSRSLSAIAVDPVRNALFYFFPWAGAFFFGYQELKSDPSLSAMMPQESSTLMLRDIRQMTDCAHIWREVTAYVSLNHQFSSVGGLCSITTPALLIPEQHLFRRGNLPPFGAETPADNLAARPWIFSDDETRFLIAREIVQIGKNDSLLRIAIKVCLLAAVFVIYATPFGSTIGLTLFIGALGIYIFSEKQIHAKADWLAVGILRQKGVQNPLQVAIDTLEKMRQQNLYRQRNSRVARVYITASGNNVLDFLHPYLTTRMENLRQCARNS